MPLWAFLHDLDVELNTDYGKIDRASRANNYLTPVMILLGTLLGKGGEHRELEDFQ